MSRVTTEIFFRPEPISSKQTQIPAPLFNRCRLLLSRSAEGYLFVPIRSMQYLAIIDADGVIFIDSQAYAVRDGEGGRMIMISWQFQSTAGRDNLNEPAPINALYHHPNAADVSDRLLGEFNRALDDLELKEQARSPYLPKVVPFPSG